MQNTSNYNLNLVEGTDLVNPPIQFNPNFQTIDAAMFANKEKTVGTASEVVTGSVHAIVRANQDADTFRYTATGAWTTGDTMTVDGTAVTVHLSDGTAPLTGAYVIGAEVLAVLNGTLVTLITSSAAIDPGVTSFNTRTGAVTPAASDYDASMIDYDNTLSGLTSTDLQGAVDELASGAGSVSITEAWVNPNPAADFDPGSIIIDSADYDMLIWDVIYTGSYHMTQIVPKGAGFILNISAVSSGSYISAIQRNITHTNDTTFSVGVAYEQNSGSARSTNNALMKPYKVYRLKF